MDGKNQRSSDGLRELEGRKPERTTSVADWIAGQFDDLSGASSDLSQVPSMQDAGHSGESNNQVVSFLDSHGTGNVGTLHDFCSKVPSTSPSSTDNQKRSGPITNEAEFADSSRMLEHPPSVLGHKHQGQDSNVSEKKNALPLMSEGIASQTRPSWVSSVSLWSSIPSSIEAPPCEMGTESGEEPQPASKPASSVAASASETGDPYHSDSRKMATATNSRFNNLMAIVPEIEAPLEERQREAACLSIATKHSSESTGPCGTPSANSLPGTDPSRGQRQLMISQRRLHRFRRSQPDYTSECNISRDGPVHSQATPLRCAMTAADTALRGNYEASTVHTEPDASSISFASIVPGGPSTTRCSSVADSLQEYGEKSTGIVGHQKAAVSSSPSNQHSQPRLEHTREGGRHRPGAYAIPGSASTDASTRGAIHDSTRSLVDDTTSSRLVLSAVLVDDEGQEKEIARREVQLGEQERRLAEQAAKLQTWQEYLERKQRELSKAQKRIVEAEIIPSPPQTHTSNATTSTFRLPNLKGVGKAFGGSYDERLPGIENNSDMDVSEALTEMSCHPKLDLSGVDLGNGPLRFAPTGERSFEEQIMSLSKDDRRCYKNLKQRWDDRRSKKGNICDFPRDLILRFARNNTKNGQFSEERAWKVRQWLVPRALDTTVRPQM